MLCEPGGLLHVRSADVTGTVADSKSVLRAAQPLCASVSWGGQCSHFSAPHEKHPGGERLSITHTTAPTHGSHDFSSANWTLRRRLRSAISKLSPNPAPAQTKHSSLLLLLLHLASVLSFLCFLVSVPAMEGNVQGGSSDVAVMHVKTEAGDENTSALVLGSHEPPAPCGDTACRGGGGGGRGEVDQTAEELADTTTTTTTPVLLCESSAWFRITFPVIHSFKGFMQHVGLRFYIGVMWKCIKDKVHAVHVLLCLLPLDPVGTDRFFTTSGDGKTYLKIAPGNQVWASPQTVCVKGRPIFSLIIWI